MAAGFRTESNRYRAIIENSTFDHRIAEALSFLYINIGISAQKFNVKNKKHVLLISSELEYVPSISSFHDS